MADTLAEGAEVDSEEGSVVRGTHATSVERRDTGPSTARDEVMNTTVVLANKTTLVKPGLIVNWQH